jgi:glycosyltransferase involved in cell wall biosynthesis
MKFLVISNLYPPHHLGGYEIGCRDVVELLRRRGHDVQVLTSNFRHDERVLKENAIERSLEFAGGGVPLDKRKEGRKLAELLRRFKPDVVYCFNLPGISLWLPVQARLRGLPVVYFLSDTTFVSWRVGAWLAGAAKNHPLAGRIIGKTFLVRGWPLIRHQTCHFVSDFLRQTAKAHGIAAGENSLLVPWGIDLEKFPMVARSRWPVRRLLFGGRLSPQKGVHTAIKAFARLAKEKEFSEAVFTIVGGGPDTGYAQKVRSQAAESGAGDRIRFLGEVPRVDLPRIYAEHDVLVFPSEWDEPFAITPLEAIASGLVVVGTTTGGSGELFRERETAMTFRAGDPADCARAIRELCADGDLFQKVSANAQREVREKHTLNAMVDKIETSLLAEIRT